MCLLLDPAALDSNNGSGDVILSLLKAHCLAQVQDITDYQTHPVLARCKLVDTVLFMFSEAIELSGDKPIFNFSKLT